MNEEQIKAINELLEREGLWLEEDHGDSYSVHAELYGEAPFSVVEGSTVEEFANDLHATARNFDVEHEIRDYIENITAWGYSFSSYVKEYEELQEVKESLQRAADKVQRLAGDFE